MEECPVQPAGLINCLPCHQVTRSEKLRTDRVGLPLAQVNEAMHTQTHALIDYGDSSYALHTLTPPTLSTISPVADHHSASSPFPFPFV
jgi:hypothetical protein